MLHQCTTCRNAHLWPTLLALSLAFLNTATCFFMVTTTLRAECGQLCWHGFFSWHPKVLLIPEMQKSVRVAGQWEMDMLYYLSIYLLRWKHHNDAVHRSNYVIMLTGWLVWYAALEFSLHMQRWNFTRKFLRNLVQVLNRYMMADGYDVVSLVFLFTLHCHISFSTILTCHPSENRLGMCAWNMGDGDENENENELL